MKNLKYILIGTLLTSAIAWGGIEWGNLVVKGTLNVVGVSTLGTVTSATIDGGTNSLTNLNATNLTSGTVPAARLPNPSASTLGGVQSKAAVANQWINSISTSGIPSSTQPAFTDISGTVAAAQLPNPSAATLGGVKSKAAVTSQWINSISTSGVPSLTQPAFTDISGTCTAAQGCNPMTTAGDIVYGGASGLPTRLLNGSAGQVLTSSGTTLAPTWTTVLTNPMTTGGDIIYGGASGVPTALANGSVGQVLTSSGTTVAPTWATPSSAPSSSPEFSNCSIDASVSGSALTVALKDAAGSNPSGGSPCKIGFRSATAATGTYDQVSTTAALSVVMSNGSAVGCVATFSCTVYVYAINSGSGAVLGLYTGPLLDEGSVFTSVVLAGGGADDLPSTLYSTAAQTSKPIRLIGRVTITPAAAFAWTNAPSEVSNIPFRQLYTVLKSTARTTTYTAKGDDDVIYCSGAAFTITLPTAVGIAGKIYRITKTDSSLTNICTLGTTSSQTFQLGSSTATAVTLNTIGESWSVVSDGAGWQILEHRTKTNPVAYTPTFAGVGTAGNIVVYSWREGKMLCHSGSFTDGTVTGSSASFTVGFNGTNNNVTLDTTPLPSGKPRPTGGSYFSDNTATANGDIVSSTVTSTNNLYFFAHGATAIAAGTALGTNSNIMFGTACVPISGWLQ